MTTDDTKVNQSLLEDHKTLFSAIPRNEILDCPYFEKLQIRKIKITKIIKEFLLRTKKGQFNKGAQTIKQGEKLSF